MKTIYIHPEKNYPKLFQLLKEILSTQIQPFKVLRNMSLPFQKLKFTKLLSLHLKIKTSSIYSSNRLKFKDIINSLSFLK